MQVILGAGGAVGNALAPLLLASEPVRLVSRKPLQTTGSAEWVGADLKDRGSVLKATKGASVLHLCAGLKYDKKVWAAEWPVIMNNLIAAGKETGARIIFFDNVYMYGPVNGPMTEETPYRPISEKGKIRARIAEQLMNEAVKGTIRASIARSADFYGTFGTATDVFNMLVFSNLKKGKKAQWLGNPAMKHSYTYVPDAAKAMQLLAGRPESDNQVWHVPTAPAITGQELIRITAELLQVTPKLMTIGKTMLQLGGLFNGSLREIKEMYYQNDRDYVLDSSKFENTFGVQPTSYREGIAALVAASGK